MAKKKTESKYEYHWVTRRYTMEESWLVKAPAGMPIESVREVALESVVGHEPPTDDNADDYELTVSPADSGDVQNNDDIYEIEETQ